MEMTPTRSNVRPQGLPSDSAPVWASPGRRQPDETDATPIVRLPSDRAPGFREFRAFRGEDGYILSNHSVEANRRSAFQPAGVAGVNAAGDVKTISTSP